MKLKLSIKILIPSLFVLFIGLAAVSFFAHNTIKSLLTYELVSSTEFSLEAMIKQSIDSKSQVELITKVMSDNYIQIAKLLAINIIDKAETLSTEDYINLSKEIGVAEIHITDENGILKWGSIEGFYGFDFNTSDQTKPFLEILKNPNFSLAQTPQLRGVDNVLFQYISVSRLDKPGIVQIGMGAQVIQEVVERVDLQNLVDSFDVDEYGGTTFIISTSGITEKHRNRESIGTNITSDFNWGKQLLEKDSGGFYYSVNDIRKYMSFQRVDDHIFCASVFVHPYLDPVKKMDSILLLTSLIVGIILTLVIILLLARLAGSNVASITQVLKNIRFQVDEATFASSETNSAFSEISSEVKSVSEALSEINLATEELSNGGEQIIDAMYILQDVSTKVRDGAIDMKNGAVSMTTAMNQIKDISGNVLGKVKNISGDSANIANVSETIQQLSIELSENTTNLESEIQRFKTE